MLGGSLLVTYELTTNVSTLTDCIQMAFFSERHHLFKLISMRREHLQQQVATQRKSATSFFPCALRFLRGCSERFQLKISQSYILNKAMIFTILLSPADRVMHPHPPLSVFDCWSRDCCHRDKTYVERFIKALLTLFCLKKNTQVNTGPKMNF